MSAPDNTEKLHALDEESLDEVEDTASFAVIQDAPIKTTRRAAEEVSRNSAAKNIDRLDWLINVTTTLDKRMERIEQTLNQLQVLLGEKMAEQGKLSEIFSSFWSEFRRRSK